MQVQVLQQVSNMEIRQSPPEIGINTVNVLGLYHIVDLLGRSSSLFACHLVDFKQLLQKLRVGAQQQVPSLHALKALGHATRNFVDSRY